MNADSSELDRYGQYFLINLSAIVILGVVMVYSSSFIYAKETFGDSAHYLYRQLGFITAGAIGAFIISKTKISFWVKYGWMAHLFVFFLILLTFVPGVGLSVKGARRWLSLGGLTLQPAEFVKYSLIFVSISFFDYFSKRDWQQNLVQACVIFLPLVMVVLQPDFGTFSIGCMVVAFCCYLSSFPRKYFYSCLVAGALGIIPILLAQPYRVKRLFTYLDPWKNPQTSGFQIIQSYLAFANGSFFGQGLGNSNEKLFYLPEAHNDFIFSVIGEELGFFGVFIVVLLFLSLIYQGLRICLKLKDQKIFILCTSIIFIIGLQSALNMGVVLGLLPTKGLNLPFISAGGSSMMANFFAVGILFSAIKWQKEKSFENQYSDSNYSSFQEKNSYSFRTKEA